MSISTSWVKCRTVFDQVQKDEKHKKDMDEVGILTKLILDRSDDAEARL